MEQQPQDWFAAQEAQSGADWFSQQEQQPEEEGIGKKIMRFLGGEPMSPEQQAGMKAAAAEMGESNPIVEGVTQGVLSAIPIPGQVVKGGQRVITGLARRMYQGALKPTKAVVSRTPGGEAALVETGLREGFTVSRGGAEKATRLVSELDDQVTAALRGRPETVSRNAVSQRLNDTFDKFSNQVNKQGDLQQIKNVGRNFRRDNPAQIPVEKAQDLKQGTYAAQAKKYGQQAGAESEAEKALARGLKEEISAIVPEVAPINARSSQVIQVRKALDDATRRTGNRDTIGLTDVIAMGTNPKALAATVLMRSVPQSLMARGLYRTGQSTVAPEVLQAAVRSLIAGSQER